ncbi:MAG: hypothetical protein PHV06_08700, partial [bacterium]|nr:hypothetical protein [bacterium]
MRRHIILLILILIISNAAANQIPYITDVKKEINEDQLNITFSLHDKERSELKVYLLDKRSGYMITGKHPGVSGDIGDKVKTGPGKKISCNLSKFTAKIIDPIIFASDGEALGTEMIKLFENEEEIVYLSRYEVMNVQFLLFLESDGYSNQEYWKINDTDIVDENLPWDYCT